MYKMFHYCVYYMGCSFPREHVRTHYNDIIIDDVNIMILVTLTDSFPSFFSSLPFLLSFPARPLRFLPFLSLSLAHLVSFVSFRVSLTYSPQICVACVCMLLGFFVLRDVLGAIFRAVPTVSYNGFCLLLLFFFIFFI